MLTKLLRIKALLMIGAIIGLAAALACSSSEPVPASEIADIVKEAVAGVETGPSAEEIRGMVTDAVSSAAPEGASAEDIRSMVEAAVKASAQPGVTSAEVEAAVRAAASTQLTAAEVQKIVDASLEATEQAVAAAAATTDKALADAATAAASQAAATKGALADAAAAAASQAAATKGALANAAAAAVAAQRTAELALETAVKAGAVTYNEAPMLAQRVAGGDLPPVEERLPSEPMVMVGAEVGAYGGTIRRGHLGTGDTAAWGKFALGGLARFDTAGTVVIPSIAKGWEMSTDGRTWTISLRDGARWSDGTPFTSEDFRYQHEVMTDGVLYPTVRGEWKAGGELPTFKAVDKYTVQYTWATPNYTFATTMAGMDDYQRGRSLYVPAHTLKPFNPRYAGDEKIAALVSAGGYDSVIDLYVDKADWRTNGDLPTMRAWKLKTAWSAVLRVVAERNPYFYAVDQAGNQLPYVDRIVSESFANEEVFALRIYAGEIDMQARRVRESMIALGKENAKAGGYEVSIHPFHEGTAAIQFNQTWVGPEREVFQNLDFRKAMSLAINREELNELIYYGLGDTKAWVPPVGHAYHPGTQYEKYFIDYDTDQANALLDGIGLDKRDSDGFRLMSNGETLHVVMEAIAGGSRGDEAQLIAGYFEAVGVKTTGKTTQRALWEEKRRGNTHMAALAGASGSAVLFSFPYSAVPWDSRTNWAPAWGLYHMTDGVEGEKPPADVQEMLDLVVEGASLPLDEGAAIAQEIMAKSVERINIIATIQRKFPYIVATNLGNVPEIIPVGWSIRNPGNGFPEVWFWR
jgi:peptide/nickel transport system substrate-binding protein